MQLQNYGAATMALSQKKRVELFQQVALSISKHVQHYWDTWGLPIGFRFVAPGYVSRVPKEYRDEFLEYLQCSGLVHVAISHTTGGKYLFPDPTKNSLDEEMIARKLLEIKTLRNRAKRGKRTELET